MRDWLAHALNRLRAAFSSERLDRDVDAEIAAHLELAIEDNLKDGMSPAEARRQALIRFGGAEAAKLQHSEARGLPAFDILLQDLQYAVRSFRRDPGFTSVAVAILALGIGANISVFSVVNTILLRQLPFPDSRELTWLASNRGQGALSLVTYSVSAYEEFQRYNQSFQQVTSYNPFLGNSETKLIGRGEPLPVGGLMIAGNFFQTLRVQPALGRLFSPEECQKGGPAAVILADSFWRRQLGGDPRIVGQAITLNDTQATVVAVLPSTFDFGSVFRPGARIDVFTPAPMDDMRRWGNTLALIGRLKPGATVAEAQAEADTLLPHLRAGHPEWYWDYPTRITGLKDHISGKLRRALVVLWSAAGLIFLIICVNLSNLMLARTAARNREFAMRSALGAGHARLVRQLVTESVVLSLAGAAPGLVLGFATTAYVAHQGSIALPLLSSVAVDAAGFGWAGVITLVGVLLFGLVPGLKVSSLDLQEALKDSGRGLSEARHGVRLRSALVISEMALACILLVGAGLLLRSFLRLLDADLGFEPSNAFAIKVDYDDGGNITRRGAILKEMVDRVSALPGIDAAGVTDMLPLDRDRSWGLAAKGRVYRQGEDFSAVIRIVTPGYLRAMGIRLVEGRDFTWQDTPDTEHVIIVNQAAARHHWPGEDPLGRLALGVGGGESRVIGVITDVRQGSLEEMASPEVYAAAMQRDPEGAELVLRSTLPAEAIARAVTNALRAISPNQLAAEFRPVQRLVDHAVSPRRFFAVLVILFAAIGLILAALGIYGVISYSVTRQTQEIGIRMALGATTARVRRDVFAKTLRLAFIGIALGTLGAVAAAKSIASLLFETNPVDATTFAAMAVLLSAMALVAGYIPARRASGLDPMIALRSD